MSHLKTPEQSRRKSLSAHLPAPTYGVHGVQPNQRKETQHQNIQQPMNSEYNKVTPHFSQNIPLHPPAIPLRRGQGDVLSKNTGVVLQEIALRSLTRSHLWGAWGTTNSTKTNTTSKKPTNYE